MWDATCAGKCNGWRLRAEVSVSVVHIPEDCSAQTQEYISTTSQGRASVCCACVRHNLEKYFFRFYWFFLQYHINARVISTPVFLHAPAEDILDFVLCYRLYSWKIFMSIIWIYNSIFDTCYKCTLSFVSCTVQLTYLLSLHKRFILIVWT